MTDLPSITSRDVKGISWDKCGDKIFDNENKLTLTLKEKIQLKALLYKERPPEKYRRKIWMTCSGALIEKRNNPNYYASLKQMTKKLTSPSENQIDLDLKRTFPDDPKALDPVFLSKLRNVLICYSIRNSSVGYCQGMNFIAGKLLLVLDDEENVFWVMVQILEYLLPVNYYCELAGVVTDSAIMSIMVNKYLPDLYYFLLENQLELVVNNFIHKWFVGIFAQNFNLKLSDIILDYFFLEGSIVLIKACIGILAILQPHIINGGDSEDIYSLISETTPIIKDPQSLLYFLAVKNFEFDSKDLNYYRIELQKPIIENLREDKIKAKRARRNSICNNVYKKRKIRCDPNWPVCIYDTKYYDINDYIILTFKKPPMIIDDYYYVKTFSYPKKNVDRIDEYFVSKDRDVLCERKKHTCDDRKLVENSVALLEENSSKSEDVDLNTNEEDILDIYKSILQGNEIKNTRARLLENLNAKEIKEYEFKKSL